MVMKQKQPDGKHQDLKELPVPYDIIRPVRYQNPAQAVEHIRKYFDTLDTPRRYRFMPDQENPPAGEKPKSGVTIGYRDEVRSLDPCKPHTMDIVNFIDLELSKPVAELIRGGMPFEIHKGTPEHALNNLAHKGYTKVHKVITPLGQHMFLAENPTENKAVFAISKIMGEDEVAHYQSLARHLMISDNKIVTVEYERDYVDQISRQLATMREKPDTWVIGGWIMGKYLEYRAKMAQRHTILLTQWGNYFEEGESPAKTIRKRLENPRLEGIEPKTMNRARVQYQRASERLKPYFDNPLMDRLLATKPGRIHFDGELCGFAFEFTEEMDRISKNSPLVEEIPKQPDGKAFPKQATTYFEDVILSPSHVSTMRYRDSEGRIKTIAVTDNPYGDISYELTKEVLRQQEPKDVVYIGSSGSILGMKKEDTIVVGDISVPMDIYDSHGKHMNPTVENALLEHCEDQIKGELSERWDRREEIGPVNRAYLIPTSHVKVPTPLYETREVIREWRDNYTDTVDVEAGEVVRAIEEKKGEKPRFAAMTYVEDILGRPGYTLGETDRKLLETARTKAVDTLVSYLDIQEILPAKQ